MRLLAILFLFGLFAHTAYSQPCNLAALNEAHPNMIEVDDTTIVYMTLFNIGSDLNCSIQPNFFNGVLSIPTNKFEFSSIIQPAGGIGEYFSVWYNVDDSVIQMINHTAVPNNGEYEEIQVSLRAIEASTAPVQLHLFLDANGSPDNPFDNNIITAVEISELEPITLAGFTATNKDCKEINLLWTTLNETNFKGYEVQKSFDGKNFTTIGFIPGQGNTTLRNEYKFNDKNFGNEKQAYYRLKCVDLNGDVSYTMVRTVEMGCDGTVDLIVSPNPASNQTYVSLKGFSDFKIREVQLMDVSGNVFQTIQVDPSGRSLVSLKDIQSGVYIMKLVDDNYNLQKRFVKVN